METYLEFQNKENNNIQYEVCISPAVKEPSTEQKRRPFHHHPGPQTYALTVPQTPLWLNTSEFYFDLNHHQDQVISMLCETLSIAIVAVR